MSGLATLVMAGCDENAALVVPPGLSARFDYVVPPRFEIPDPPAPEGEYEIYTDGPLHPDVWTVRLNGCASTGSIVRYQWSIDGSVAGTVTDCDSFVYDFPAEATYTVSLMVEGRDGEEASQTAVITVRDLLIFGVGDSYASGEGNPDVRVSVVRSSSAVTAIETDETSLASMPDLGSAQWQNRRCHRSAYSGQVRAAQLLEEADPHSSVTFVHLACSGARIHRGLLEEYAGVEEDGPPIPPQIERVAELADGHEIDALLVSIGGNDVNFSKLIEACILGEDCHLSPVDPDPALQEQARVVCERLGPRASDCQAYFDSLVSDPAALDAQTIFDVHSNSENDENGNDIRQDGNDDLPDNYRDLAEEIVDGLGMDPARVYLTEIPDVTRNEYGQYCGWDLARTPSALLLQLPGVTRAELTWADVYVSAELRATMHAAADEHGWQLVSGIATRFRRHGYCSIVSWLVRLPDTFAIQGDQYGVLHPNATGHGVYATAIAAAIGS